MRERRIKREAAAESHQMDKIEKYTIAVPESAIQDLERRLNLTKFPDEMDDARWDLGTPLADVKRLVTYWRDKYDWRRVEADLNCTLPD